MNKLKQLLIYFTIIFISFNLHAGASDDVKTNSEDFETSIFEDEIYDPLEGINRAIFGFNNVADKMILEPAAKGYKKLPAPVQSGVGNFIQNLKLPLVAFNQLLQGQGKNAAESTGRFLVNSTIGIFGLIDVADDLGLEQKEEDFGQTLATWGVGDGFYDKISEFEKQIKSETDKVTPLREKNIENLSKIQRLNLELQSLDEENTRTQKELENSRKRC